MAYSKNFEKKDGGKCSFWRSASRPHASPYPNAYKTESPTQSGRMSSTPELRVALEKFRCAIKGLGKELFTMLPEFTDTILVASDGDVPAHRVVLAARSTVMKDWFLLRGVRKEADGVKEGTDRIILDGHSKDEVETFLELLYTGDSAKFADHIRAIFLLAQKYQVEDVMALAEAGLYMSLNTDNAVDLFLLATGEKDDALSTAVVQFIEKPVNKILHGA
ncbi:hypothetical protein BV898_07111 [Hypsibius exemplaris]|uniref:BTB domain-containing protein n=1 Tax=Hypsibius exemplaris TaxID=2072580 RepID=A0A1W0WUM6_HYPEX|nr:hypothetical protein BV898_07111 [Hypsibius exemplaris]